MARGGADVHMSNARRAATPHQPAQSAPRRSADGAPHPPAPVPLPFWATAALAKRKHRASSLRSVPRCCQRHPPTSQPPRSPQPPPRRARPHRVRAFTAPSARAFTARAFTARAFTAHVFTAQTPPQRTSSKRTPSQRAPSQRGAPSHRTPGNGCRRLPRALCTSLMSHAGSPLARRVRARDQGAAAEAERTALVAGCHSWGA